jgi:hypothetical protein
MTGRAGVDRHFLLGGTGLHDIAASTGDRRLSVVGMDVFLHVYFFPFKISVYYTFSSGPAQVVIVFLEIFYQINQIRA